MPPEEAVELAVDTFQDDNTGAYTLEMDLGDIRIEEIGFYSVVPDDAGVQRTYTGGGYDTQVRYLRRLNDVWLEIPDTATNPRDACYVHGNIRSAAARAGIDAGDLPLVTPAVEVVLTLQDGREEDGQLVADASLRALVTVLGYQAGKDLDLPKRRTDVPVRLTMDDDRISSWTVSLDDVVAAMPDQVDQDDPATDPFGLFAETSLGDLTVEFSDPGQSRDFSPPPEENSVEADAGPDEIEEFSDTCRS